jgi:dethiobiotin synthetase
MTQKLVQTGCSGRSEDILLHRKLMGKDWQPEDAQGLTCPYCFPLAASPHLAAEQAGVCIETSILDQASQSLAAQVDYLLIEGAGGVLVPLTRTLLFLDYIQSHHWPLLLVTSPRLGSINHTLLCLEVLQQRQIKLMGLVYNLYGNHHPALVRDSLGLFRESLTRYGFSAKVILFPDLQESRAVSWGTVLC